MPGDGGDGAGIRIAIVPGNGGGNVRHANWYGWAEKALARYVVDLALKISDRGTPPLASA